MFNKPTQKVCLLAGLMALTTAASATTNTELDLSQMTEAASAIVTGQVLETQTQMQGKAAQTLVSIRVTDEIKGDTATTITVALPGGSYTSGRFRVGETHAGTPQIFANQRSLYFLSESNSQGVYQLVGFNQGMVAIEPSANGDVARGTLTRGQAIPMSEMKAKINGVEEQQ